MTTKYTTYDKTDTGKNWGINWDAFTLFLPGFLTLW